MPYNYDKTNPSAGLEVQIGNYDFITNIDKNTASAFQGSTAYQTKVINPSSGDFTKPFAINTPQGRMMVRIVQGQPDKVEQMENGKGTGIIMEANKIPVIESYTNEQSSYRNTGGVTDKKTVDPKKK